MSETQRPPGVTGENDLEAAHAEVLRLRQAIAELIARQEALLDQQAQIQGQITRYDLQAQQARDASHDGLAQQAEAQRQQAQARLVSLEEEAREIGAQKKMLAQQQVQLLSKIESLQRAQQAQKRPFLHFFGATPARQKDAGAQALPAPAWVPSRRFVIGCGLALLALVIASGQMPRLAFPLSRASRPPAALQATSTLPPPPLPTPTLEQSAFTPAGTAPTDLECQGWVYRDCYSPEQIQQAFSLTSLYQQGYDGAGQTIVILGAGYTTSLNADLHQFDLAWGLPDPSLQILFPHGPPAPYTCPYGSSYDELQIENTLDVEWSHAIAPGASIVLIIGDNGGGSPDENCGNGSIPDDVSYALNHHLGQVISISYGGSELGDVSETAAQHVDDTRYYRAADAIFQRAASQGVTVLAAAGDDGATNPNDFTKPNSEWNIPNVGWPASDPYVLAVGGTVLDLQGTGADGRYNGEAAWNYNGATGGGLSSIFSEPDYQKTVPDQTLFQGKRGIPDVAFPAEGFVLYESFEPGYLAQANAGKWPHWDITGGTSTSTPCWAGLVAIADQMRGRPLGLLQLALYRLQGQGMHDITAGNNTYGGVQGYQALPGYDLVSGWGSPIADELLPALMLATGHQIATCQPAQHQCT